MPALLGLWGCVFRPWFRQPVTSVGGALFAQRGWLLWRLCLLLCRGRDAWRATLSLLTRQALHAGRQGQRWLREGALCDPASRMQGVRRSRHYPCPHPTPPSTKLGTLCVAVARMRMRASPSLFLPQGFLHVCSRGPQTGLETSTQCPAVHGVTTNPFFQHTAGWVQALQRCAPFPLLLAPYLQPPLSPPPPAPPPPPHTPPPLAPGWWPGQAPRGAPTPPAPVWAPGAGAASWCGPYPTP